MCGIQWQCPDGWTAPNMFAQAPAPRQQKAMSSPEPLELPSRGPDTYGFVPIPWTGFRSRASTTRTWKKFWNWHEIVVQVIMWHWYIMIIYMYIYIYTSYMWYCNKMPLFSPGAESMQRVDQRSPAQISSSIVTTFNHSLGKASLEHTSSLRCLTPSTQDSNGNQGFSLRTVAEGWGWSNIWRSCQFFCPTLATPASLDESCWPVLTYSKNFKDGIDVVIRCAIRCKSAKQTSKKGK